MKGEINSNTTIVGDFNTHSHIWIDQLNKINKETQTLNDTIDQLDLTDICRIFQASFLITVQKYYMSTTGKKNY